MWAAESPSALAAYCGGGYARNLILPLPRSIKLADSPIPFALVGSETLIGREIRDLVATSVPDFDLRLIDTGHAKPGAPDDAVVVVLPMALKAKSLSGARAVFLAGPAEANRKAIELVDGEIALI